MISFIRLRFLANPTLFLIRMAKALCVYYAAKIYRASRSPTVPSARRKIFTDNFHRLDAGRHATIVVPQGIQQLI